MSTESVQSLKRNRRASVKPVLGVGDRVKVRIPAVLCDNHVRLWVEITKVDPQGFDGVLLDDAVSPMLRISAGTIISFSQADIVDVKPSM